MERVDAQEWQQAYGISQAHLDSLTAAKAAQKEHNDGIAVRAVINRLVATVEARFMMERPPEPKKAKTAREVEMDLVHTPALTALRRQMRRVATSSSQLHVSEDDLRRALRTAGGDVSEACEILRCAPPSDFPSSTREGSG